MKNNYIYFIIIIYLFSFNAILFSQMGQGNLGLKGSNIIGIQEKIKSVLGGEDNKPEGKPEGNTGGEVEKQGLKNASGVRDSIRYNPALDNHYLSPDKPIGLFGMKMKDVERILISQGAKRQSYAFGKYNKLTLSIYLLTVYFDKKRIVSGVSITPKPPYKRIEPHARKYFMELFLDGHSLAPFKTQFLGNRLEIKYIDG